MEKGRFADAASTEAHPDYAQHVKRREPLYGRTNDIRSPYERDYTRILHSLAYRRLKHKTQVFFNIGNDHVCTRMEHVQHVESVSCTIAKYLGLNADLTRAIAMGHDLGHAPFGHEGEVELTRIRNELGFDKFWHERNSLRMIDSIELLEDNDRNLRNLDLTYAVRDGIISHCGEVDENGIYPRSEAIDLDDFTSPGQYQPYTWEGCVVKISDKIAYLGRDIEDAMRMDLLSPDDLRRLGEISAKYGEKTVNTTVIIHNFIISICENSSPETGIRLSEKYNEMLNEVKHFNYDTIYMNPRFRVYRKYAALIIRSIYETLMEAYSGADTLAKLLTMRKQYPALIGDFAQHISCYSTVQPIGGILSHDISQYRNTKIYGDLGTREVYGQAIIDFISGMTDRYAVEIFNELLTY